MINQKESTSVAETIKTWVELYSDKLYSWALHKTSSKETAEDLVQETFLVAVQSFEKFKGESKAKTWLFAILNNKIHDHYRKAYKSAKPEDDIFISETFNENGYWQPGQSPQPWAESDGNLLDDLEFRKVFQACLNNLPENGFSVMQLKYMKEKKGEHICQELGITDTNYWQILHRAKLQLRKCLALNWFKN